MKYRSEYLKDCITVMPEGDLDAESARETREYLDKLIDGYRFDTFIIDFAKVDFMDSTGIGVLLGRYKRIKALGADLCVTNVRPQVDKVFRISGLYQIIKAVSV
ncbi:MAG TPA: anti-sigma F factor antagonist [Clostridiales bacterium]|nr:anti-sigma F factor antagonist [Clostridiales bacterium]